MGVSSMKYNYHLSDITLDIRRNVFPQPCKIHAQEKSVSSHNNIDAKCCQHFIILDYIIHDFMVMARSMTSFYEKGLSCIYDKIRVDYTLGCVSLLLRTHNLLLTLP